MMDTLAAEIGCEGADFLDPLKPRRNHEKSGTIGQRHSFSRAGDYAAAIRVAAGSGDIFWP